MAEEICTFCNICMAGCGLVVSVENDRIVEIRGDGKDPNNRGGICAKGRFAHHLAYAPDRLTTPLVRTKGKLKSASWQAALERITDGLERIKKDYGPQGLALYRGTSSRFLSNTLAAAFCRLFGTPNNSGTWSICVGPKIIGYRSVFGGPALISDFARSRLIVLFGANPQVTRMHRYFNVVKDISSARREGAKLVVVDPRKTPLAKQADLHLPINPGTDSWLIMALAAGLIRDGGYNQAFVDEHCLGFQELASSLEGFDFDQAARITGLDRGSINQLTHDLATIKPAALDRREGLIHHRYATSTNQALAVLIALTGNVDLPGGLVMSQRINFDNSLGLKNPDIKPFWKADFPLTEDASGQLAKAITAGGIRGLISIAGNPMAMWPNTEMTANVLGSLDFLVVNDLFMTETALLADVVLPGACFLEKGDLDPGPFKPGTWLRTSRPVIPPVGRARAEWRWLLDLVKIMGHDELNWITDADSIMARVMSDSGLGRLKPSDLRRGKQLAPQEFGRYREHGFNTPSGRVELCSSLLSNSGYDPLPRPEDACPTDETYPWRLITGHRLAAYYHSGQRNVQKLRKIGGEAMIEVSPSLAQKEGLIEGQTAVVKTAVGEVRMPVHLVPQMNPNTVAVPHGWPGELNANRLIPDGVCDPVTTTPTYRAVPCQIRPA